MIKSSRSSLPVLFAVFSLILALSSKAFSQDNKTGIANVTIKNFGQMDDRFYRGGQPKEDEYKELAALGIGTVIDLRDDPTSYEKQSVEAAGMKYVNIPMSDKQYPETAKIEQFLKLVDDPTTGKFYVHCAGGRHRTGVMGAVYRIQHGWDLDKAYKEMKDYDYYSRWGHGSLKDYVQDYSGHLRGIEVSAGASSSNH